MKVLWPELIGEWELSAEEAEYVDRQQGKVCKNCGANLRVLALGNAIKSALGTDLLLKDLVKQPWAGRFRVLDLNGAGALSPIMAQLPGYIRGDYPEVDMHALPYKAGVFDLVIHSDTLEHVQNPIAALIECRRVLAPEGRLCFTVPIVVGRMSRSREGLPKSYHGGPTTVSADFVVQSEFGADAWTYVFKAGFQHVALNTVEYPAAHGITAWKKGRIAAEAEARFQVLEKSIDAVKRSRSWRITQPLRTAVDVVRRILRR
jgi:SAM-dependent methyltransferase